MAANCPFLLRANEIERQETDLSHPWNPRSRASGVRLGRALGLERTSVSLVRVAPGCDSFIYHSHRHEEQWLFVLSGCGVADIEGDEMAVAPGDFLAFPAPSVPHELRNPFDYELVYLVGGEHRSCEIEDFPRAGKRLVRTRDERTVYDLADGEAFEPDAPRRPAAGPVDPAAG